MDWEKHTKLLTELTSTDGRGNVTGPRRSDSRNLTLWCFTSFLKRTKLKKLNIELPHDPAIQLLGITQKNWKQGLRYLYTHVHSCIIHNSQKVEATQASIDWRADEQNAAFTYNKIIHNLKKEGNSDTCYTMNKPWVHYAKKNKSVTRGQILHDFTYIRSLG